AAARLRVRLAAAGRVAEVVVLPTVVPPGHVVHTVARRLDAVDHGASGAAQELRQLPAGRAALDALLDRGDRSARGRRPALHDLGRAEQGVGRNCLGLVPAEHALGQTTGATA